MKKLIALLCMLTCVLSMTACGSNDTISDYQASKLEYAKEYAVNGIIPTLESVVVDGNVSEVLAQGYTEAEWEAIAEDSLGIVSEGDSVAKALDSFLSARDTMGAIVAVGEATSVAKDDEIIVNVDVAGGVKDGQVELIFSNDQFMVLKSCTLNVDASFGELMAKAAMNTLLGMGSVFAVLVLIMIVISMFGYIPKIQAKMAAKKDAPAPAKAAEVQPVAPVTAPVAAAPAACDDAQLVAVIAAAIAAYEGTSTDGFVVRSIKKAKRR